MQPATKPSRSERIRLLIVNSTLHIGGAEQVAATLAERIPRDRFDVTACYLKEPGIVADQMLRAGVDLLPIPGWQPGRKDYASSLKLRRLIVASGAQVIHTHDLHGYMDGAVCRLTLPGLRHVHTFHFGNYPHRSMRHKMIERLLWRVPDALVAVGHAQAATIRSLYRIPEHRLHVIHNGVADAPKSERGEPEVRLLPDAPPGVPVIASISTLIPQKGLEHLLDAAALLRNGGQRFLLLIAGEGKLRAPLEEQTRRLGLTDYVRFLGWVPQAPAHVFPLCDVFVQSSLWEAMSVVVLEAMAAAKPMVLTTVGENPHVAIHGETGLMVPPADARALADALHALLRDETLRARLGRAARKRYEESFTVHHMIENHARLYRDLVLPAPARVRS